MGHFTFTTYSEKETNQKRLSMQFMLAADEQAILTSDVELLGVFASKGFDISVDMLDILDAKHGKMAVVRDEVIQDEGDSYILLDLGTLFKKYAGTVAIEGYEEGQKSLTLDFAVLNEDEKSKERDIHMQLFIAGEAVIYQKFSLNNTALKI